MIKLLGLVCLLLATNVQNAYSFGVATGTTWSTEAAVEILRKGGNATDAIVAASFVLNVTQPYNMGVGGGGFFLAEKNGKIFFWDSREKAPASAHPKMFLNSDGKPIRYYPERVTGPNPVGVPGMVMGLYEAHRKLGKLPWKDLLQPAIKLARGGFPITRKFEEILEEEWPRISKFPASAALFGDGEGTFLKGGRIFRNPLLAQTLEKIATKGPLEFYLGDLARSWISEAQKLGVKITLEDLKDYKVDVAKPIAFDLFEHHVFTAPPPSGAGLMVAGSLRYLEHYYHDHDVPRVDSAARVIVTAETLNYFQKLRDKALADPPYGKVDPQKFLNSADERAVWKELDKIVAARLDKIQTKVTALPATKYVVQNSITPGAHSHTTHLSIVDDHGMSVAYTTTIEQWFGSGMVVPGHGFLLNNELSDFSAEPDNVNAPAAGKRPRSNMSPTLMFSGQKPVAVVGSAGGGRIPTTVVELLENYYIFKMNAHEAISFARFHPEFTADSNKLDIERSIPNSSMQQLKDAGYTLEVTSAWTTAQAIMRRDPTDSWEVAAEPRSDSLGFRWEPLKKSADH